MTTFAHINALLFDLDGTLLDSFQAHYRAYQVMLPQFGIHLSREEFYATYSPDWLQMYAQLGIPREQWDAADEVWLTAVAQQEAALFPDVKETLARLMPHYRMALVTAGSKPRVRRDLARVGLGAEFEVIVTGDDVVSAKPDPEGLHLALSGLGVPVTAALYVGDTAVDYETARSAPMPFIGRRSGFTTGWTDDFPQIEAISELLALLNIAP